MKQLFLSAIYLLLSWVALHAQPEWKEGFEGATKGGYAKGEVRVSMGAWMLDDALLGNSEKDQKAGDYAVRVRNSGKVTMLFDAKGAGEVSLLHATYGSDGEVMWELWYSTNGGQSWKRSGNTQATNSHNYKKASFQVNIAGNVRFEIRKIDGTGSRLNVDNFRVMPYGSGAGQGGGGNAQTPKPQKAQQASRDASLALGNPSKASKSTASADNYLIERAEYASSYNKTKGTANWTAWHLSEAWMGAAKRQDDFREDATLPSGWYKATPQSYSNSGFDRGHLCPSGDRSGTASENSATFLMTNMVPQAPHNNQRTWNDLEEYCRALMRKGMEMYIIAGVHGRGGAGASGKMAAIDNGRITVPEYVWKIVLLLPNGGNDLARIDASTRVIAVLMPNSQDVDDKPWTSYRVSVKKLEELTGYDFFSALPKPVQQALEGKVDSELVK